MRNVKTPGNALANDLQAQTEGLIAADDLRELISMCTAAGMQAEAKALTEVWRYTLLMEAYGEQIAEQATAESSWIH